MISFVLGVYSGLTAEPGNEKRGGSRSYPSDFMDDHGPLTCLDDDTFRETRLYTAASNSHIEQLCTSACYYVRFVNNASAEIIFILL